MVHVDCPKKWMLLKDLESILDFTCPQDRTMASWKKCWDSHISMEHGQQNLLTPSKKYRYVSWLPDSKTLSQ